jgi:hypothetical protein
MAANFAELPVSLRRPTPYGSVKRSLRRCRGGTSKLRDRCQHLSPVPEQDADALEIFIGLMAEYRDIDPVLGKALGVLGHAERGQPVRNLLHHQADFSSPALVDRRHLEFILPLASLKGASWRA